MSRIIPSYRRVFRVDRRIYKLDPQGKLPIPVPGGLPLRSAVYFLVTLGLMALIASRAPISLIAFAVFGALAGRRIAGNPGAAAGLIAGFIGGNVLGQLIGLLGWQIQLIVIPFAAGFLGDKWEPDGRAPHRFVVSWLAHRMRRARSSLGRPVPTAEGAVDYQPELAVAPDQYSPVLRRARIVGPGTVEFRDLMVVRSGHRRSSKLRARPRQDRSQGGRREVVADTVDLGPGEVLEITP